MKVDHTVDYFYKYPSEIFDVQFSFLNDLNGDTLNTCTASIYDLDDNELSSTMISNKSVSSPSVIFSVKNGDGGETYQIKLVGTSNNAKKYVHYIKCEVFRSVTLNSNLGDPSANTYVTLKEANDYIRNKRGHNSVWDTLSIEGKKRLLFEAAQDIDMFNFVGEQYYENQTLQFPRDDHDVITGNCGTPLTINGFSHANFTSDTYGEPRSNTNYWKYGSVHITEATPLEDVRRIDTSNITTNVITVKTNFTATPTTNTQFIAFEPLHQEVKDAQCEQALHIIDNIGKEAMSYYSGMAQQVKIGNVNVKFKTSAHSQTSTSNKARKLLSKWIKRNLKIQRS